MPRFLIALVALIATANLYGQEAKKPSPQVKRILDKAVAEVRKNRQEFDKANQKPLGDARVELKDLSKKLIEQGKTVDASVVLKQIETLDVDVMRMADAPAPMAGGGGQQKPLLERMVGKWWDPKDGKGNYYEIRADRTIKYVFEGEEAWSTELRQVDHEYAEAVIPNGVKWHLRVAGEDVIAVSGWGADSTTRGGRVLERIK